MSFPWLTSASRGSKDSAERLVSAALRDLRERAAMYARLGYTAMDATARLKARIAWDFERGRPPGLSDGAIDQLVLDTYERHAPR